MQENLSTISPAPRYKFFGVEVDALKSKDTANAQSLGACLQGDLFTFCPSETLYPRKIGNASIVSWDRGTFMISNNPTDVDSSQSYLATHFFVFEN